MLNWSNSLINCISSLLLMMMCNGFLYAQTLEPGMVHDSVETMHDPDQTYALYLPHNYDPAKKWPVIFLFEPAARGTYPLPAFIPAAEKYGIILICSNNSRNGSWDLVLDAADAMLVDVQNRFSIDLSALYAGGFSGGSRAATAIAVMTGKFKGVIGCGAGLPPVQAYQPTSSSTYEYVGIVGTRDMNYQEHIQLQDHLEGLAISNHLIFFEEGHEWPAKTQIIQAFDWFYLQDLKRSEVPEDRAKIREACYIQSGKADSLYSVGQFLQAYETYSYVIREFGDMLDCRSARKNFEKIKEEKSLKSELKVIEKYNKKERAMIRQYLEAFREVYDLRMDTSAEFGWNWWKNELKMLDKLTRKDELLKQNLGWRMKNLISARATESSIKYLARGDRELALILNQLWLEASPNDVYACWHMAKIHALEKNADQTMAWLEKARAMGMQRPASLERPEFAFLRGLKAYDDLLLELKNGQLN